ncbi:universal stress protein [Dyella japonica]|uniref:Nucleotide-binding universal stress UspA family protein n=1 Tax=Dyella japonica TaxID=231455 RepID=A0ABV2JP24_9GAMM
MKAGKALVQAMRDILLFCESFKHWNGAAQYAAMLAASRQARLTGLYVCPVIMIPPWETPGLAQEFQDAARQLKDEAFGAGPNFEQFAHALGAAQVHWQVTQDEITRSLSLAGTWHDVIVIGRSQRTLWGTVGAVGNMVLGSGMPCIVVPDQTDKSGAPRIIVIAWNGSSESMRAVHAALPLLQQADKVIVLHGKQQLPPGMADWQPPFELSNYLAARGIGSESLLFEAADAEIGKQLLSRAREVRADMLVMGAYGHTRFSEWVLGGATREVLETMTMPVFMRH